MVHAISSPEVVPTCAALIAEGDLHGALRLLNARTRHRFTGVYLFDPPMLRSLCLFDRENPGITRGGDTPLTETYCAFVLADRSPYNAADTRAERRLGTYTESAGVLAYCGVPVRAADGASVASLCHFDPRPRLVPDSEVQLLRAVADLLSDVTSLLQAGGEHSDAAHRPAMHERVQVGLHNEPRHRLRSLG